MRIVGVDPGKKGYAIALDTVTKEGFALQLPFDAQGSISMAFPRWLMKICHGRDSLVLLEKLNGSANAVAKGRVSTAAVFKMGFAYGQLDAVIRATLLSSRIVTPQQWQKLIFEGIDQKLIPKDKAMVMYQRLFPGDPIPRRPRQKKPDDNAIDAFWIAQYGALKFGGGQMIRPEKFVHCGATS